MHIDLAEEFPLAPGLIYLNHAAVAPWPRRARDAACAFADENLQRGAADYPRWMEVEARLREQLRQLINARGTDEIALLKNTSEGLSVIAAGLAWQAGDEVLIPAGEFPSNRIVWESLAGQGVRLVEVEINGLASPEDALIAALTGRTRLVSVSQVKYDTGLRLDLGRLGRACEARGILFCIDAIQGLGVSPLDVRRVRADFVVADGHKWLCGPEGLALFYCRRELLDRLQLHQYGWHMVEQPFDFDQRDWTPANSARRFECGSPNMLAVHTLSASLGLWLELGVPEVAQRLEFRIAHLEQGLAQLEDRYCLLSPREPGRRAGILTLRPRQGQVAELFEYLRQEGVICAQRGGGVRLSPHCHTPLSLLDRLLTLLECWPATASR